MKNDELNLELIWKTALGELEVVLTKATFTTWFPGTILDSCEEGVFTVGVANFFYRDRLTENYLPVITKALKNASGLEPTAVKIRVVSSEKLPVNKAKKTEVIHTPVDKSTPKETGESGQNNDNSMFDQKPRYTFETFIVGANNRLAHAAAFAVSENPGKAYNPLYIYGPSGLGKTHLLKGIENEIKKKFPKKSTLYTSSETFTNDFINSIRTDSGAFRSRYRGTDVLIVDDIQFIGGKEGTQEEFFHTFNFLHQNNKQVVLASDRIPRAIKGLEERLVTRFEWGMLADISKPDLETRSAILWEKCREKGYQLPEEIINFIATQITSSIRELEGALNKIMAESQLNKIPPSLALAESVLRRSGDKKSAHGLKPTKVFRAVSTFFNIKHDDLVGKKRNKELIKPRQLCMYLLRTEASMSFPEIAREMGGKDHSTIMYGCKSIEKNLATDEEIKNELALLKESLRTN
jgi:chromosomal replication initiator protein